MEINSVRITSTATTMYTSGRDYAFSTTTASPTTDISDDKRDYEQSMSAQAAYWEMERSLTKEDFSKISRELSRFMELLNADIRFSLHEKSQQLMVQVVDIKQNKVLKEFPPHELLDTMAKIREFVGALLDKKI